MIGIYKITSPSGKVYIGQSIDIERRWTDHKWFKFKTHCKLRASFIKYGPENHIFEVIEECEIELLNDREGYWQDFYECVENGLNSIRVKSSNNSGYLSLETRLKISESRKANPDVNAKRKGIPLTDEHKIKIGNANRGKKHSEETLKKISENRKGKRTGESHHNYGKGLNEKSRKAFSEIRKKATGSRNHESKTVIDLETGIYYDSIREASFYKNIPEPVITGRRIRKCMLVIADDYENNTVKEYIRKPKKRTGKKITDDEFIYNSIKECCEKLNIPKCRVYKKLKNNELKYV